jgi:hypothetical protein
MYSKFNWLTYIVVKHQETLLGNAVSVCGETQVEVRGWCRLIPGANVQDQFRDKVFGPVLCSVTQDMLVELLLQVKYKHAQQNQ